MLVRDLLEKLDNTNSEIDWIEIICNGESKSSYSLTPNEKYLNKEVKKFSLRIQDEYNEDMNGVYHVSYTDKILVIEVK